MIDKRIGDLHHDWKGDEVSYKGLHQWMRRHIPKPDFCQSCKIEPPRDMANVTGIYNREPVNWKWLCRSCHKLFDYKKIRESYQKRYCKLCGSTTTFIQKKLGRTGKQIEYPLWIRFDDGHICNACYCGIKYKQRKNIETKELI
jgi:hypothetical protein